MSLLGRGLAPTSPQARSPGWALRNRGCWGSRIPLRSIRPSRCYWLRAAWR